MITIGQVGLKDIANALNVSQSTVSRALRNKPGVNPKLQERIFKMAQDLNYPFKLPKAGTTKRVGVVIPDLSNQFFATVRYGIDSVLRGQGYLSYYVSTDENQELEGEYVKSFIEEQEVDGLIVAPSAKSQGIYRQYAKTFPLIFFDRHHAPLNVPSVLVDNKDIIFRAALYLVGLGHREICYVAGNEAIYTGQTRNAGFKEALKLLNLNKSRCPWVAGNFKEPEVYEAAKAVLAKNKCTAIIASSNKTTGGVLRAVGDLGLSMPADISVIGFDDQEWMEFIDPPLTTIVQPAFSMGTLAASLLVQKINGKASKENVILKAGIKKRGSVRAIGGEA